MLIPLSSEFRVLAHSAQLCNVPLVISCDIKKKVPSLLFDCVVAQKVISVTRTATQEKLQTENNLDAPLFIPDDTTGAVLIRYKCHSSFEIEV